MRLRVVTKFVLSGLVVSLVALLLFGHRTVTFSPAPLMLPGSEVRLWVELKPSHPYLAEYDRMLFVTRGNSEARQTLFPDTGGYGRLNIYLQGSEAVVVKGPFEELLVHLDTLRIEKLSKPTKPLGAYLAAYAKAPEGTWRFIPATEAGEVSLEVPQ